jgi:hypothetical protein
MNKDGGPAFPRRLPDIRVPPDEALRIIESHAGMSLRDYFAAAALQGMLAYRHVNPTNGNYHENCSLDDCAMQAYEYADAMLAAREKP